MMNTNHLLLATLALFLAEILDDVQSSPTFTSIDTFDDVDMTLLHRAMRQGNDCDSQDEVRELCQRCAKVTRSTVAYPLCCQPRENPRIWCMKFLAFGISK